MLTGLRKLWGVGLAAGTLWFASADLRAEDAPAGPEAGAPAAKEAAPGPKVPESLRSKESKPDSEGVAHLGNGKCANCKPCKTNRSCTTCDDGSCSDCRNPLECLHGHNLGGHFDGLHDKLHNHIAHACDPNRIRCRYGYFFPQGSCGEGTPFLGHYHMGYAVNPYHFDPRDAGVYSAQGYGVPMAVPLPPIVEHTYNYSWGLPSSRLTPVARYTVEPGIIGPPTGRVGRGPLPFVGAYSGNYPADRVAGRPTGNANR